MHFDTIYQFSMVLRSEMRLIRKLFLLRLTISLLKMKQAFSPLNRFPVYYAVADIQRASAFDMREKASYRK